MNIFAIAKCIGKNWFEYLLDYILYIYAELYISRIIYYNMFSKMCLWGRFILMKYRNFSILHWLTKKYIITWHYFGLIDYLNTFKRLLEKKKTILELYFEVNTSYMSLAKYLNIIYFKLTVIFYFTRYIEVKYLILISNILFWK